MDIISVPVTCDEIKIDSRYRFVIAASKRVRQLHNGAMPKIAIHAKKLTTVAIEEILSGSLCVLSGEDAVKARKNEDRLSFPDMMDKPEQKHSEEELTGLEKDLKIYLHKKKEKADKESREKVFPKNR